MKDYIVMIDDKNFFDQPIKSCIESYENITKFDIGQGDGYTIGCLPGSPYFKENCKMTKEYKNLMKQEIQDIFAKTN